MTEGWMAEKPPYSRCYHYIVETRALCGRYGFYMAELMADAGKTTPGFEDCAECFKRLRKRSPSEVRDASR